MLLQTLKIEEFLSSWYSYILLSFQFLQSANHSNVDRTDFKTLEIHQGAEAGWIWTSRRTSGLRQDERHERHVLNLGRSETIFESLLGVKAQSRL